MGRRGPWERGWAGRRKRLRFPYSPLFFILPMLLCTSLPVTRASLSSKNEAPLEEAEKEVFRALFTRTQDTFFLFQENSSGPLILHYRAVAVKT